jgi:putative transposase
MLTRELKLKLTKKQETQILEYFYILTGVYNSVIRSIELNPLDKNDNYKVFKNPFYFNNLYSNHAKRVGIHSQVLQQTVKQACNSWERYFKKLSKKPRLKGIKNKLHSFCYPQFDNKKLTFSKIKLPSIGEVRYHKQEIPLGKIKQVRILRKASGYYVQLTIDTTHKFKVNDTDKKVGIDTGFKHLAILSDGIKYENQRNFIKSQTRLAQSQRGRNKKLTSRIHERIANKRKDYNHKVSKEIVVNNKEIYVTKDNLRNQTKIFGKSVSDAGIAQLRSFIAYKSANSGRLFKLVDSKYTTMICSECMGRSGPTGLSKLKVRAWECSVCRTVHDRDINSARVILKLGAGTALEQSRKQLTENSFFKEESSSLRKR